MRIDSAIESLLPLCGMCENGRNHLVVHLDFRHLYHQPIEFFNLPGRCSFGPKWGLTRGRGIRERPKFAAARYARAYSYYQEYFRESYFSLHALRHNAWLTWPEGCRALGTGAATGSFQRYTFLLWQAVSDHPQAGAFMEPQTGLPHLLCA